MTNTPDVSLDETRRSLLRIGGGLGVALFAARGVAAAAPPSASLESKSSSPDPASISLTTADVLIETLIKWDVAFVFGIVGDGINPLIESLRRRQDKIRFIAVRHEEAAAFMASGYAKHTGKLGVCLATTGPGAVARPWMGAALLTLPFLRIRKIC